MSSVFTKYVYSSVSFSVLWQPEASICCLSVGGSACRLHASTRILFSKTCVSAIFCSWQKRNMCQTFHFLLATPSCLLLRGCDPCSVKLGAVSLLFLFFWAISWVTVRAVSGSHPSRQPGVCELDAGTPWLPLNWFVNCLAAHSGFYLTLFKL